LVAGPATLQQCKKEQASFAAKDAKAAARETEALFSRPSRSLMNDSEWVVKEDFYHPLALLARVWEAVREEVFSSTSTIGGVDR
jgi:hypothetical protein